MTFYCYLGSCLSWTFAPMEGRILICNSSAGKGIDRQSCAPVAEMCKLLYMRPWGASGL